MRDFLPAETKEMDKTVSDFIQDRAFDGVVAVLIVAGRGYQTIAYAKDAAPLAPELLEWARNNVLAANARQTN